MPKNLSKNQIHELTMLVLNQLDFQEANEFSSPCEITDHVVQKYIEVYENIENKNTSFMVTGSNK